MARQCGTSGRWVGSDGGLEAVGTMLRGEPGAGAEGEWEAEAEAEGEGEAGGVPLTFSSPAEYGTCEKSTQYTAQGMETL